MVIACIGETMAMVTPDARLGVAAAERFVISAGGAESNVALALSSFGEAVMWLSRLGDDALGDRILSTLDRYGVETRWVVRDSAAPTGIYIKDPEPGTRSAVSYYRRGSAASKMAPSDVDQWPLAEVDWAHISGITPALSPSCDDMITRLLERRGSLHYGISFDVNYRPALWPARQAAMRCLQIGRACDVVLVGLDEAEILWGTPRAEDVAALFPTVSTVVVKDGDREAVEFTRDAIGTTAIERVPAEQVEVVEAVGAGDAFAAGYLHALLGGQGPRERLAAGHAQAAWTLGTLGDFRVEEHI